MKFKQYLIENEIYEVAHISRKSKIKTNIPPNERSFKNLPRDSKKKPKCRFQDWLGIKGNPGKGFDGKWYGYSHRAIYGFSVGETIKKGSIGNKYEYSEEVQKEYWKIWDAEGSKAADKYQKTISFEPYTIKTDDEAKEHADRFRRDVS